MGFMEAPVSWATRQLAIEGIQKREVGQAVVGIMKDKLAKPPPHSQHPNFGYLTLLVFEAVLEVVCVSLPGYLIARLGMFDAEQQKFVANLNVSLFTPCLIFTKLASQLTAEKLIDLAIIPFIFVVQTIISYVCARVISKIFRFKKRQQNFVVAMGVFGNSNSLPISLVISLSQTLKGLHWDKIPNDNDDEVGARGILYLLIFQQLGQLLRWSWGYNVLLKPANKYTEEEGGTMDVGFVEDGQARYRDDPEDSDEDRLLMGAVYDGEGATHSGDSLVTGNDTQSPSGESTPVNNRKFASVKSSRSTSRSRNSNPPELLPTPANGNVLPRQNGQQNGYGHITSFPDVEQSKDSRSTGFKGYVFDIKDSIYSAQIQAKQCISAKAGAAYQLLPPSAQKWLSKIYSVTARFANGVHEFMNPPLWAMLIAIIVASVPALQHLFFDEGTFVRNSVTRAIGQSGGVAVPLILVVLGANLARNTLPATDEFVDEKEERNLLIASLLSRMLLPTILMAPLLALVAKFVPVSIVDDNIFVIVCFLLTGAPSALQLAQICQVNNVFMGVMSKILFQSYVVWILPSTLVLVLCALEVVEWATY